MNIILACLFLIAGLFILWKCADLLVSGAVGLAERLGVSPLVIGLTIVAMGTSAPEVAASIAAVARGMGDIAVGNVFGSNIANLALVGGISALIRPLEIKKLTLWREIPVMILVALLLWPVLYNLSMSRPEGLLLLCVFIVLILLTVFMARKDKRLATENTETGESDSRLRGNDIEKIDNDIKKSGNDIEKRKSDIKKNLIFVVISLAGLALGAEMTVRGAVFIGKQVGLSEAVIGLTIIAVGTSLPELATCVVAAIKGHHDISVGNLVGSNIFNAMLVTGAAGMIWPFTIGPRLMEVDYWIMIIVSAAFAFIAILGRRIIGRIGGAILLCGYTAFIIYRLIV